MAITKQMELFANVLISIPSIGRYFLLELWLRSETSTVFKIRAALAKYAGLAWQQHQSSNFKAKQQKNDSFGTDS